MIDREKIIKGLSTHKSLGYGCDGCPYEDNDRIVCVKNLCNDAITLLKEQEPKPVKVVKTEYDHELYYCPRCDRPFCDFYYVKPKFCDKCGQAVKWNEIV